MTFHVPPFHLRRALQELTLNTASFRLASEALEETVIELALGGNPADARKCVAEFQAGVVALGASLLALARRAERAITLAELGE